MRIDVQYGENPTFTEWTVECDKDEVASSVAGSVRRAVLTSHFFNTEPIECEFKSKNLDEGFGKLV